MIMHCLRSFLMAIKSRNQGPDLEVRFVYMVKAFESLLAGYLFLGAFAL